MMKIESTCHERTDDRCIAERPRYFPRQLITPGEMTLEQEYFRNKLRRHNRLLHGWGVVCGALVCPLPRADGSGFEPWKVVVKRGYILGPYGDEIIIDSDRSFDLRTMCLSGISGEPCVEPVDPWCSEVFVARKPTDKLYVAVKYKEIMTRPVRVQPVGCGCDETQCEYSRFCDGYEICVLTCCTECHRNPPNLDDLFKGPNPECPPCPSEPWVVLAEVEVDEKGTINKIDNCSCRRIVLSLASLWYKCATSFCNITKVEVDPNELKPRLQEVKVTVTGGDFQRGATVQFDSSDVTITEEPHIEKSKIEFKVNIAEGAVPGVRSLTILNPDCTWCRKEDAITIAAAEARPAHPKEPARPKVPPEKKPRDKRGEE